MKRSIAIAVAFVSLISAVSGQSLTNEVIQERILATKADKEISLTFNKDAGTSMLAAISENFAREEASRSGIIAMNLAVGFVYPGTDLPRSPEMFQLTFRVVTLKPQFAKRHDMTVSLRDEILVIGSARYVGKPREGMEHLNFDVSRENLTKIASTSDVRFQLGDEEFTFTRSQMKMLADVLMITAK